MNNTLILPTKVAEHKEKKGNGNEWKLGTETACKQKWKQKRTSISSKICMLLLSFLSIPAPSLVIDKDMQVF